LQRGQDFEMALTVFFRVCFLLFLCLVAGLVFLASLVVMPVGLACSAMFVIARLAGEDQCYDMHLARVTARGEAVPVVWVLGQSRSVGQASVVVPGQWS
jgi:hypothetical protein